MKKFAYIIFFIMSFLLTSCGARSGYFQFEGKFLNMNQGEFYAYSPDGGFEGIDTIKVQGGRFTFEKPCKENYTIMIVFPNFSEQPIFAEPGEAVTIKADASHLKEMEVKGTKVNETMTKFRQSILKDTPPQEKQHAEDFIKDNPASPISLYLIKKYFCSSTTPDYEKASQMMALIEKEQPKSTQFSKIKNWINIMKNQGIGKPMPTFTAYDVNGKLVSSTDLSSSPVAIVYTWATYNYDSQDLQRELKRRQRNAKGKLKLMGICLDASKYECKNNIKRDSITSPTICTGDMLEDKTTKKLGLASLPDNILLQNGKIIARSMKKQELYSKLDQLLK